MVLSTPHFRGGYEGIRLSGFHRVPWAPHHGARVRTKLAIAQQQQLRRKNKQLQRAFRAASPAADNVLSADSFIPAATELNSSTKHYHPPENGHLQPIVAAASLTSEEAATVNSIPPARQARDSFPQIKTAHQPNVKSVRFSTELPRIYVVEISPIELKEKRMAIRDILQNVDKHMADWSHECALITLMGKFGLDPFEGNDRAYSPPASNEEEEEEEVSKNLATSPSPSPLPAMTRTLPLSRWSDHLDTEMDFSIPVLLPQVLSAVAKPEPQQPIQIESQPQSQPQHLPMATSFGPASVLPLANRCTNQPATSEPLPNIAPSNANSKTTFAPQTSARSSCSMFCPGSPSLRI